MDRRVFLGALAGTLLAIPRATEPQPAGKVWRIGYLSPAVDHNNPIDRAFDHSMQGFGYVEGRNLRMERRYSGGQTGQLAAVAGELVGLKVDVIVVWSPAATFAVKNATNSIPIIFLAGPPAGTVLAKSLSRPAGNVTGITLAATEYLWPKYLEMLKALIPALSHVALLYVAAEDDRNEGQPLARAQGIRVSLVPLRGPEDIKGAFARVNREKPQGLVLYPSGLLYSHRREFIDFAAMSRLPAVYGLRELVPEGALMSLGADLADIGARGPIYVDKILKGMKPADLPIEQPTKFELVVNVKTAKALGLTIPQSLLLRADQVIE